MHVLIHQSELKAGVSVVGTVVSGRPVMPVLSTILLQTTESGMELRATDLESAIVYSCTARVDAHGAIAIPAKLLADLVNNLPFEIIDIFVTGFTALIKCGTFECQINGLDPQDFPTVPVLDEEAVTVEAKPLHDALVRSMSAVATDDSRPVLTAIRMSLSSTEMTMVSADGFRLSKVQFAVEQSATPTTWNNVLVPAKTIGQLIKSMPDSDTVKIARTDSKIQFILPKATYISRLIEGNYPDVERVFPKDFTNRMVVDSKELRQALKVARLLHPMVRITIMENRIILMANDNSRGNNSSTLDVVREGEMHSIALNVSYLDDALYACMASKVIIETKSAQAPAMVRPMGDENYWHIVMPMAVH